MQTGPLESFFASVEVISHSSIIIHLSMDMNLILSQRRRSSTIYTDQVPVISFDCRSLSLVIHVVDQPVALYRPSTDTRGCWAVRQGYPDIRPSAQAETSPMPAIAQGFMLGIPC